MSSLTIRLQHVIQRLQEIPPLQQDEIARLIEEHRVPATILPSYAGSMPDLPDDFEEELMRRRHDVSPTPPLPEQLQELLEDESE